MATAAKKTKKVNFTGTKGHQYHHPHPDVKAEKDRMENGDECVLPADRADELIRDFPLNFSEVKGVRPLRSTTTTTAPKTQAKESKPRGQDKQVKEDGKTQTK